MPRITFPSPLTIGLAQGIPQAGGGILEVLRLLEQQRHRQVLEAGQERSLNLQEQAAARVAQEFARVQALRGGFGKNLATAAEAMGNLRVGMTPGAPGAPAFAEPFMGGALSEAIPPSGAVGPIREAMAPTAPTFTRPDPFAAFQTPEVGAAFQGAAEVNAPVAQALVAATQSRLEQDENRQRITESNRLLDEARTLGVRDPNAAMSLMFQSFAVRGLPVSPQLVWDAIAHDPEAAKEDGKIMWPILDRALQGDKTAVGDLYVAASTTRGPLGPILAGAATKLLGQQIEQIPGGRWISEWYTRVEQKQKTLPKGQTLSDEDKLQIALEMSATAGGQVGFTQALAHPLFKGLYERVQAKQKAQAVKEGERAAIPPAEREVELGRKRAETKKNLALADKLGREPTEKPGEKKERTKTEAQQALVDFEQGRGPDLSDQELLNLQREAGLGVPRLGALDPKVTSLKQARKKALGPQGRGGGTAPRPDPLGIR